MTKTKRLHRTETEWLAIVNDWNASKLNMANFAKKEGISYQSLRVYCQKFSASDESRLIRMNEAIRLANDKRIAKDKAKLDRVVKRQQERVEWENTVKEANKEQLPYHNYLCIEKNIESMRESLKCDLSDLYRNTCTCINHVDSVYRTLPQYEGSAIERYHNLNDKLDNNMAIVLNILEIINRQTSATVGELEVDRRRAMATEERLITLQSNQQEAMKRDHERTLYVIQGHDAINVRLVHIQNALANINPPGVIKRTIAWFRWLLA